MDQLSTDLWNGGWGQGTPVRNGDDDVQFAGSVLDVLLGAEHRSVAVGLRARHLFHRNVPVTNETQRVNDTTAGKLHC